MYGYVFLRCCKAQLCMFTYFDVVVRPSYVWIRNSSNEVACLCPCGLKFTRTVEQTMGR